MRDTQRNTQSVACPTQVHWVGTEAPDAEMLEGENVKEVSIAGIAEASFITSKNQQSTNEVKKLKSEDLLRQIAELRAEIDDAEESTQSLVALGRLDLLSEEEVV